MKPEPLILLLSPPVLILLTLVTQLGTWPHADQLMWLSAALWLFAGVMCVIRGIGMLKSKRKVALTCIIAGVFYLCLLALLFMTPLT